MAGFDGGGQSHPHARQAHQGDDGNCLLPAQRAAFARTSRRGRPVALGRENRLPWVLNAVMNEDQARNCDGNSTYNLAILRHMALNLMQTEQSRVSLRSKFNLAGWKDEFLAKLLVPT